jgi:hypothetical protein
MQTADFRNLMRQVHQYPESGAADSEAIANVKGTLLRFEDASV